MQMNIQHSITTWVSTHLSTGYWYVDMALVTLATVVFTSILSALSNPSSAIENMRSMLSKVWRWKSGKYTLTVEYNTTLNRWGDVVAVDCSEHNEHLLQAIFAYLEYLQVLKSAKVDVRCENLDSDDNKYEELKKMVLGLRPCQSFIRVNNSICVEVLVSLEEGGEKKNRIVNTAVEVTSNRSFDDCRVFAQAAYDHWVEKNFKHLTARDEKRRLKYYSVRNIDHEGSGDIVWNEYLLGTSRTMDYLFFDDKEKVLHMVDAFLAGSEHYKKGGPAHKLGFLLYGKPGCGKTSFIKALANYSQRHIFDIHVGKFVKNSELRDAFFQEDIVIRRPRENNLEVNVPLSKRIIIMEDIDAISNIVKRRSQNTSYDKDAVTKGDDGSADEPPKQTVKKPDYFEEYMKTKMQTSDRLSLGALLSILDGTLELTGPIVIMTTNHPEQLDPALIRSGRISKQIYFGNMSTASVLEMLQYYYKVSERELLDRLPENFNDLIPPNDLEAICKNNENLDMCCLEIHDYVAGKSTTEVRVDEVAVDSRCSIRDVRKGVERVVWRTATWN